MKTLLTAVLFFGSLHAFAGDKVGNGGGIWTCSQNGKLSTGILVDIYEAREEFGLDTLNTIETDPMKIVQERSNFVRSQLPEYSLEWNKTLIEVTSKMRLVNSELVIIDDALFRIKPLAYCPEPWVYTQFANFTILDQVLIRADLWNENRNIAPIYKAALIWHEVIYKWLRDTRQDQNSVRTRQIVGILFSQLSAAEMKTQIARVLNQNTNPNPQPTPVPPTAPAPSSTWMCTFQNSHTSSFFAGYGKNKIEASTRAKQECGKEGNPFFCDADQTCDELKGEPTTTCQLTNNHSSQTFLGSGRSRLEAEYEARKECQKASNGGFFCDATVTCN